MLSKEQRLCTKDPMWYKKKPPGGLRSRCTPPSMQSSDPHLFPPLSSLPFPSWQMVRRGTDHAEPNPSYLAEDHTDGQDRASWTHRQLGAMMHRMLPINRMCCSAGASRADTPDRGAEGGPAKRPKRTGRTEMGAARSRGGTSICAERVESWSG